MTMISTWAYYGEITYKPQVKIYMIQIQKCLKIYIV